MVALSMFKQKKIMICLLLLCLFCFVVAVCVCVCVRFEFELLRGTAILVFTLPVKRKEIQLMMSQTFVPHTLTLFLTSQTAHHSIPHSKKKTQFCPKFYSTNTSTVIIYNVAHVNMPTTAQTFLSVASPHQPRHCLIFTMTKPSCQLLFSHDKFTQNTHWVFFSVTNFYELLTRSTSVKNARKVVQQLSFSPLQTRTCTYCNWHALLLSATNSSKLLCTPFSPLHTCTSMYSSDHILLPW